MLIGDNALGSPYRSGYSVLANKLAMAYHPVAATIDWTTVTAVGGVNAQWTVTITGTPTGGTFTISYGGQTTSALAFNATPDTVETAVELLSSIGNGNVRVSGTAGSVYTLEFIENLRHSVTTAVTASGASLTGGTPVVTVTNPVVGVVDAAVTLASGLVVQIGDKVIPAGSVLYKITPGTTPNSKYGYAVTATTLVRGETLVNDHDLVMSIDLNQAGAVFDNGNVITSRLLVGGTGQPTLANLQTACPALRFFQ